MINKILKFINFKNVLLLILSILVFSGIFSNKYLAGLDSVYFYKEAYKDLTSHINIWSSFNAPFGDIQYILWLYPITYLSGLVGKILNIDWNILARIFFYIPSLILSFYSIQRLSKYFNFSNKGKFLMSLIYVFNTYFLMLVDGGQLGVMLAYSIFPLAVESILDCKFFKSSVVLSIIGIFDPRFLLISVLTGLILDKFKPKKIIEIMPSLLIVSFINFYWIYPLLKIGSIGVTTFVSELKLTSFISSLFLYQPHWPYNEFGKTTYPNILFIIFPILLIVSYLYKPTKEKSYWLILFTAFSFIVKGETDPLGIIYTKVINSISMMSVFRDSTKFFAPLIIVYSLIVSRYYDQIKNKLLLIAVPIILFIPLVSGLILGGKNNLKGISDVSGITKLKDKIKSDGEFLRVVYVPNKPQLAYQTETNQAIDGRVLANYIPFAADNYGSEDRFNFMLRNSYINYFRSLGIKKAVLVSKNHPIVADIENSMPGKYYIDKLAVVVGSPIGVEKLVPEYGVVFLEDGNANLNEFLTTPKKNLFFYLNNKTDKDLLLASLKDRFIDPSNSKSSSWALYSGNDYLTWKYQLLIREIDTKDINFGGGIALSTVAGEEFKIDFKTKPNTKYKVFIRGMAGKDSKGVSIDNVLYKLPTKNVFGWVENSYQGEDGNSQIAIKNNGGFNVIGQVLIIEEQQYLNFVNDTKPKINNFRIYDSSSNLPISKISFEPKEGIMIFNQSYNNGWRLGNKKPFAVNGITNGFYISKQDFGLLPEFEHQKLLDFSSKISLASVLGLVVSYFGYAIYQFAKTNKKNN